MASGLILAVVSLLTIILCSEAIPSSRVLGGDDASSGEYPWVASVRVDKEHACMGTIINNRYIITAAHCVYSIATDRITARIGSINKFAGGQIVQINFTFTHPYFTSFLHDIAVIKTVEPLAFTDKINKIMLATTDDVTEAGAPIYATGWGIQENESTGYKLRHVSMNVLSAPECEVQAGYGYKSVICLKHPEKTGLCRGDEGAGVVSGTTLVGVASFSFGRCGTEYPDISSKISFYRTWIDRIIEET